jgi:putative ABC transport system substrate-binding protein
MRLVIAKASTPGEIDPAFTTLVGERVSGLVVAADPFFSISSNTQIAALAARYGIPATYSQGEVVKAGGLISYGTPLAEAYRMAGTYVGRILKGEKPADLPVQQTTKIETTLNLKTAKTLGLEVPTAVLLRADEIIE